MTDEVYPDPAFPGWGCREPFDAEHDPERGWHHHAGFHWGMTPWCYWIEQPLVPCPQ